MCKKKSNFSLTLSLKYNLLVLGTDLRNIFYSCDKSDKTLPQA